MKGPWIALAAIALVSLTSCESRAQVAAASAKTPAAQPNSFAALSADKRLAFEGGLLRLQGAVSFDRLLTMLPAADADALRQGLGYRSDAADQRWSSLLRSAVQFQKVNGTAAETLWWSPAIDAGIAISWSEVGADWGIVAATPVLGETLRGEPVAFHGGPAWSNRPDPQTLATSLQRTASSTRSAVLAGTLRPLIGHPAASIDVLARTALMDDNLALRLGASKRNVAAHLLLTRAPAQVKEPGNAALGHLLASFSDQQRLMFAPRLVVSIGTSETVLWVSAGAPNRVLLVAYPTANSIEPPAIADASLAPASGGAQ